MGTAMRQANQGTPVPPGEMLEEEFLKPLGLSRAEAARRLGVPASPAVPVAAHCNTLPRPIQGLRVSAMP